MNSAIQEYIQSKLNERRTEHNFRTLPSTENLIDFTSNDYLGLARDTQLHEKVWREIETKGTIFGSTGSRLLSGNSEYAEDLEKYLAAYHQAEAALLFNSGYVANYGLLSALPYRGDTIIYDELVHASIHDGIRTSKAASIAFRHNDMADLETQLKSAKGRKYVVVESLYSMDGDLSPLREIVSLSTKYDAGLIVDEAHATGVMGKRGEGRIADEGLQDKCLARIHTFGKAIGGQGAVILCSQELKDFLINYCRPFIFSTALPAYALAHIRCAFEYLKTEDILERRKSLFRLVSVFEEAMKKNKSDKPATTCSPIQTVRVPGNEAIIQLAQKIRAAGFDVRPIKYPTVAKGAERIRICLHSFNKEEEVRNLARTIHSA